MRGILTSLFLLWSLGMAIAEAPPNMGGMGGLGGMPTAPLKQAEDPKAMWFQSPAGQHWQALLDEAFKPGGTLRLKDAIRIQRQRFPNAPGPGMESVRPAPDNVDVPPLR